MDAGTRIAIENIFQSTSILPGIDCVMLCDYNPKRLLLIISRKFKAAVVQPLPPGFVFDPSVGLPSSIELVPTATGGGFYELNLADQGPLVTAQWWAEIDVGGPPYTIVEVISLGCLVAEIDLSGLSRGRGSDDTFSMGLGTR